MTWLGVVGTLQVFHLPQARWQALVRHTTIPFFNKLHWALVCPCCIHVLLTVRPSSSDRSCVFVTLHRSRQILQVFISGVGLSGFKQYACICKQLTTLRHRALITDDRNPLNSSTHLGVDSEKVAVLTIEAILLEPCSLVWIPRHRQNQGYTSWDLLRSCVHWAFADSEASNVVSRRAFGCAWTK